MNRAAALLLLASALSVGNDALIKHLGGQYPPVEAMFVRTLVGLAALLGLAAWRRQAPWRRQHPGPLILYGGLVAGGILCWFLALPRLPLPVAITISFTTPLMVTALAAASGREQVAPRRWLAVGMGFVGVLVLVRPGGFTPGMGAALALLSALLAACSRVMIRALGQGQSALGLTVLVCLAGLTLSGPLVPGQWVTPAPAGLALMAGLGLSTSLVTLLTIEAFRLAQASFLSALDYSRLVLSWLVSLAWFGEAPDLAAMAGGLLVVGAGLLALRER